MNAIIVTGGKQYKVAEGDVVYIEKLDQEAGDTVKFDQVLAVIDGEKATFGTPVVELSLIHISFSPLLVEMEGGAIAQVCLRNGVRFAAVKSVSDHLFSDNQAQEYFDFGEALERLGKIVLPLALKLKLAMRSILRFLL